MPNYQDIISGASNDFGVPADIIRSVISVESSWNPSAVGSSGEKGLMQLMPGTAAELGVSNAFDPQQNIRAGAKYLSQQYKKMGNWRDALARYNAGKYYAGSQGQGYADKVISVYKGMNSDGGLTPILDAKESGGDVVTAAGVGDAAVKTIDDSSEPWYIRMVNAVKAWFNEIYQSVKKFLIDNLTKLALILVAVFIIAVGIWKLINS